MANVIFTSVNDPRLKVVVEPTKTRMNPDGTVSKTSPRYIEFRNGRVALDAEKDENAIAALRRHRDYGVFIKEINESKMKKKLEAEKISIEQVVCPNCKELFSSIEDMKSHAQNCNVKEAKSKTIRGAQGSNSA